MLITVIMAGGRGERFWPKSRRSNPKQFLDLFTGTPLIVETVHRVSKHIPPEHIYIITEQAIAQRIHTVLPELKKENVIAEPMGKNTAAAVGIMSAYLKKKYNNSTLLVLSADHLIPDRDLFMKHVQAAVKIAEKHNALVTFGIQPTYPETGFGYVKSGKLIQKFGSISAYQLDSFHEKPDIKKAKQYLINPQFNWNSGMFCWTCDSILSAIEKYMPPLHKAISQISPAMDQNQWPWILNKIYPSLDNIPIDKGVMEKAENAAVIKSTFEWYDIGSWVTLDKIKPHDKAGNVLLGQIMTLDTQNCVLVSEKPLLATIGLSDLIIVATNDVILVCPKKRAQDVRKIVQFLEKDPSKKHYL